MAVTITLGELAGYLEGGAAPSPNVLNTRTTGTAQVRGTANTVISAGSRARTTRGDVFRTAEPVTIPAAGQADVLFESVELGGVYCVSHELTTIVDRVRGWISVDNRDPFTLGDFDYLPLFFEAAKAAVLKYAPTAPDAIHNRAVQMVIGYWATRPHDDTSISRELDGDRDIWSDTKRSGNALRFSNAMPLLSPFKRRRALG